ncbi:glycosyltransferase family 1 protein [Methylobacterium sp. WL9]|uniref:glycosyltransferase family 4 protein n=1 Tax=Methylobacterium sp. WL9 TaxID=2603898 RepID=UPI0011CB7C72|nr:glycosyltransferase family 1 protein [Methylobacterium sp. WL9]TXN22690.1 glycosyltransferase family 4 protein [Methylobacterium sp. WL9]
MKLAMDGGAFQQGIAAGIFNVAVGLMNAVVQARPDIGFVLVADPRLGPVREELLDRLSVRPDIVHGEVGPAYGRSQRALTTDEPNIRFEVDGLVTPAPIVDGKVVYEGPAPVRSFRILSRADKPSMTRGQGDERRLGVLIDRIAIQAGAQLACIGLDHPWLRRGVHGLEGLARWTDGAAELPTDLFPPGDGDIEVTVGIGSTMTYRLADGLFDASLARVAARAARFTLRTATAELEHELMRQGVSAYVANHFLPVRFERLPGYAILYDMIPVLFPEFFFADARQNFANNVAVFENADHVFSISETSRQDLVRTTHVTADRVTAMMIDIDPAFARRPGKEIVDARRRYGLEQRPYILTVGTLEPRKNHARLVEAFSALVTGEAPACDLVLIGKPGWGTDGLMQQIARLGLARRVHVLTGVPNEDLAALYSGALFTAYPSLYEGFGLPVLEAMACGCPVMTSDRSSMPEIAGEAALLVDPTSVESLVRGLYTLMTNGVLRDRLAASGLSQRQQFSWDTTARRFLDVVGGR